MMSGLDNWFHETTRRHRKKWLFLKWTTMGVFAAATLFFTGGFAAIPFLAPTLGLMGPAIIVAATPVLALGCAVAWHAVGKPLLGFVTRLGRGLVSYLKSRFAPSNIDSLSSSIHRKSQPREKEAAESPREEKAAESPREKEAAELPSIMTNNSLQMLKTKVGPFLENEGMNSLARTSRTMHGLFKENLTKAAVKKLLQHVAYGEEKEADSLLEQNPHLLQHFLADADTVTDYAGHCIHGTAYRIALGAEDERMLAMLQRHFSRLENGREAMQAQHAAQFPVAEEKAWADRQNQDSEALRCVIKAIADAPNKEACAEAIKAFHAYMDKPKGDDGVIRTGRHFNARLLVMAVGSYNAHYSQFGGWCSWKNNCFWRQIIGYIQRHLPACYAQAFCQGILGIVNHDKVLRRSLELCDESKLFPLDLNPRYRLGHDYAMGSTGSGNVFMELGRSAGSHSLFNDFLTFIRQKEQTCINYVESLATTPSTGLRHPVS